MPKQPPSIVREIRDWHHFTQTRLGTVLGLTFGMVSHLETGRRHLDQMEREVRYRLLDLAQAIPSSDRSEELTHWINIMNQEFATMPLGARYQLEASNITINVQSQTGNGDVALEAIRHLVLGYDTHYHEKTEPEAEADERFYEELLTLLVRHAYVDREFAPELSVADALLQVVAWLRDNGRLQTTIAELPRPEEDDEDNQTLAMW